MDFREELGKRILILDGAMGTMLQNSGCCNDGDSCPELLNLTHPDKIQKVHEAYIEAGADIIETNSFGANRLSLKEFGLEDKAYELACAAARIARKAAEGSSRKIYVAGSMGPTGKSLTLAANPDDLCSREIDFDSLSEIYSEQIRGLADGGADLLILETCFDPLNAKAAIYALEHTELHLPLIISATVSDRSGRMLTGHTLEAFYTAVRHSSDLVAFGINCALGAEQMLPLAREIASFSDLPLIFYPNAGMPDEMGHYNDSPEVMAGAAGVLAREGLVNICGGCCGSSPAHIKAIAEAVRKEAPRIIKRNTSLVVSGLEAIHIDRDHNFCNIGERTNVAGSKKFARLVATADYTAAMDVARAQIDGGADVIDINMDDPMVDSSARMRDFLRQICADPSVAKAAIMIDSSHWETLVQGLKNCPGKGIVNSISLKEGEDEFLRKALEIKRLGAAVVVMAFDEKGQAESFERKIEICRRSYELLTLKAGIRPCDVIFDCNVLTIGTGIAEHAKFGIDFIEAVRWIKNNLDGALTSGGISNLSFAFRGNNKVREAMHSVFLYHAIRAGLDMAIVNPQMLALYDDIDPSLAKAVEDVILNSDDNATSRLLEIAGKIMEDKDEEITTIDAPANQFIASEILTQDIVKGRSETLFADLQAAMDGNTEALSLIEGPLMAGMEKVGQLFAEGRMFLPQVVKSASIMKQAVEFLQPYIKGDGLLESRPVFVIATVQGDVHDIGKNITAGVLQCSGFNVIDLGVMVPAGQILEKAKEIGADIIGVSGLITPSLHRMEELCHLMAQEGMTTPLFVGGAAASAIHTAVKLSTIYPFVYYGADASATAVMAKRYLANPDGFRESAAEEQLHLLEIHNNSQKEISVAELELSDGCLKGRPFSNITLKEIDFQDIIKFVDWRMFFAICGIKDKESTEALRLKTEAETAEFKIKVCAQFFDAHREGDDIVCEEFSLPMLRGEAGHCLADYFSEKSTSQLGILAINAGVCRKNDIVDHAIHATAAETVSALLKKNWESVLPEGQKLIIPAIGYACCPDHSLKRDLLTLLPGEINISLTESCAMIPEASICALVIANKAASYQSIGEISSSVRDTYASRRHFTPEEKALFLR